ncbi:hypothetical protein SUGI_0233090 [Cryptomeria japonica]|uniref:DNA gyrase subunit A, chloroplastic/mitochondrial isoform X2 n=1 Tax=Cryptomeria japonica TaxID=3369 RepID=UPI002408EC86|nr:DNA gyrase subunit A, chloroplastic/mitochondrial isoform X2 [Cryptomeria japonica]GLJ14423.1 hypothetical protein SUGI_0233090 [Cryptomeria japonica]
MALSTRFLHRLPLISFSLYRSSPAFLILRKCQSQRRLFAVRSQTARFLHVSSGENELGRRMKIQATSMEEVAEDGDGGEEPPENGALFERPLDERIVAVELHKEATDSYLAYAMSVLFGRALPDVRDGLKPVHRRILFAMHELGLSSRRPYKKCARVVGEVLGKFHPHGDTAVYDALVRMAQGFSLRSPLISGHGNFGSVDADPPAAMRYTEARLEAFSEATLLADLEFDTVDFVANFDGSQMEPSLLPARLPHVLLNGASGIAVGMATNIPPHNLREVTDALIALIHNPAATVQQLMEYMPGPDFPTGGKIMGDIGILEAYRTGRGSLIVRGKTNVELLNKKTNISAIIITELPYQTNKASLVEKIAQLVDDKELEGISSIRDESDRTGMRVVLELKRGVEPSIILNNLYKSTALQSSFSCNMVGILGGRPKLMGLKDMLEAFLEFRCSVVERRAKFLLKVAEERDHIVKGILIGLGNLDRIISLIRESRSHSETITALKEGYSLSEKQAEAILNITLRKLTSLERNKFMEEHKSLSGEITNLIELLGDRNRILQVIEKEALELKEKFGTPRRSVLEEGVSGELDELDVIPNEEVLLALSKKGYMKRMKPDVFNLQNRGTVGKSIGKLKQDDSMSEFVMCRAHDHVLYFSNKGTAYAARAFRVPECSRTATGIPLLRILSLSPEEKITSIIPVSEFRADQYLVMLTAKGYIKRVSLDVFSSIRSSGIIAIQLVPGDELKWARCCAAGDLIAVGSQNGKLVLSYCERIRKTSRTSRGSLSMRLKGEDKLAAMDIVPVSLQQRLQDILQSSEHQGKIISAPWLLLVSENGYGKRVPLSKFRATTLRCIGVMGYKLPAEDRVAALFVVGFSLSDDGESDEQVALVSHSGTLNRIMIRDIRICSQSARGVRLMRLEEGGKIQSASILAASEVNTDDFQDLELQDVSS